MILFLSCLCYSSCDSLLPLSSLCKLEHLTLQQSPAQHPAVQLSNPICGDPDYATKMSDIFPTLHWLDKEVVKDGTPGRKFYDKCRAIEENSSQKNGGQDVHRIAGELYSKPHTDLWPSYDHIVRIAWSQGSIRSYHPSWSRERRKSSK